MSVTCDECHKTVRGEGNRTVVRVLCDQCHARSTGAAVGLMTGGSVGDAVATAGIFSRLKARRQKP